MKRKPDSFKYPEIDTNKCIECQLCIDKCPENHPISIQVIAPKVYLAWTSKKEARLQSSSGGLFYSIADEILSRNGVVCGARYDEEMNLIHDFATTHKTLKTLQGSKYIQSDIRDCYSKTREYLQQGRWVYFTGTPCQIAGLKKYLGKPYEKLITSDLICHGVPSNDLWKQQIAELEKKSHDKIIDFRFRSKKRFGQGCDLEVIYKNHTSFYNAELLPYFYGFWNNITLRECCYHCRYTNTARIADITLGDFWLAKQFYPDIKMSKGLSLIMINSGKGEELFNAIKDRIEQRESTLEIALSGQGQLKASVPRPGIREAFTKDYPVLSFHELSKKYLTPAFSYRIKCHLRNLIKILIGFKYWK